jgi:hypothetical protein
MNDTLALSHRILHDSGGCESPVFCEWLQCKHGMGLYAVDERTAETMRTILWSAVTRNDTQGITPPHGSSEYNTVPQTGLPMRAGLAHTPVNWVRSTVQRGLFPACLPVLCILVQLSDSMKSSKLILDIRPGARSPLLRRSAHIRKNLCFQGQSWYLYER